MGMVVVLTAVSDVNVRRLLEDPPLVWKVVFPEEPGLYEDARKEARGWFARLFSSAKAPLELFDEGERPSVDLDKAWHAIHYLLTGEADEVPGPLGFLVSGGAPVGAIEVGYGPARAFTSSGDARDPRGRVRAHGRRARGPVRPVGDGRKGRLPRHLGPCGGAEGSSRIRHGQPEGAARLPRRRRPPRMRHGDRRHVTRLMAAPLAASRSSATCEPPTPDGGSHVRHRSRRRVDRRPLLPLAL